MVIISKIKKPLIKNKIRSKLAKFKEFIRIKDLYVIFKLNFIIFRARLLFIKFSWGYLKKFGLIVFGYFFIIKNNFNKNSIQNHNSKFLKIIKIYMKYDYIISKVKSIIFFLKNHVNLCYFNHKEILSSKIV